MGGRPRGERAAPARSPEADRAAGERRVAELASHWSRALAEYGNEGVGTAEEYARYAAERGAYLAEYDTALRAAWAEWARERLIVPLAWRLVNTGAAPADDVDVHLHVPDGPDVVSGPAVRPGPEAPIPDPPSPPVAPRSARRLAFDEMASRHFDIRHAFAPPAYPFLRDPLASLRDVLPGPPANVAALTVTRGQSHDVHTRVRRVKQTLAVDLPPAALEFADWAAAASLTITYRLVAANVPDPVEGSLHVVLRKGASPG